MTLSDFDILLKQLLDECVDKFLAFQETCYSFEEWFNWELYYKLSTNGFKASPKPKYESISRIKKYADISIENFKEKNDAILEVKLIHDSTQDKWINEIDKDWSALQNEVQNTKSKIGLQLLLMTSSGSDILNDWQEWLQGISFWKKDPLCSVSVKKEEGEVLIMVWEIPG